MKFIKGLLIGTIVSAGVAYVYTDSINKRRLIRTGKKIAKKMNFM